MTIEKLDASTPDLTRQNIERLLELFPECRTEGSREDAPMVDFDLLRQALSDYLVEGPAERYRLDWPGKRQALLTANTPIDKTLRPMREESVDFDTTRNLFIEGDNLDALKLLQETYLGKVKMIYIDPPYNTGSDFVYDDDFAVSEAQFSEGSEQRSSELGKLVSNPSSNGRFHSDWMTMIYSRLRLARNLLSSDGLIFISIDDNEQSKLRQIADEIFGEENFVDQMVWKKRYGGGAKEKHLITLHEYVLVFAKDIETLDNFQIPLTEESIKRYYKSKDDNFSSRGPYRTHPLEATKSMGARPNLVFPIPGPDGELITPKRQWLWSKERVEDALRYGELEFVKDRSGGWSVHTKQYLRDRDGTQRTGKPFSIIDDVYTQHGTNEVIDLFGDARIFPFPKPTAFLKKLLEIALTGADSEIVVDLFAGSGSLAHAISAYNYEQSTRHRCFTIQIDEIVSDRQEAREHGYATIAEVTRERIRRAGKKIIKETPELAGKLDTGFRAFRTDSGNFVDTSVTPKEATQEALLGMVSHIKDDRSEEDLLFGALLRWGVDITLPIEQRELAGRTVWLVDAPEDGTGKGAALIACFAQPGGSGPNGKSAGIDTELADAMAELTPLRVLFRDDGFASDAAKENVHSRLKQRAPDTQVRVL
ncbi:site-specific DNA-methyltransferase [Hyphobacterium marinum]|uniref:site-specific DNA-methyltransferase (adenine-specific) n=1 Tax=Hyphobacterium marinum TaxID=3116574 RepID=A0ABU7LWB7_9PROT|nr:site-specific DNA-methyltransferase [Hyphobacterium sp. Y6023]MEE2565841.1 site-specific DNA-methyltransferase [Hyphobacterium sp. Y6023]